MKKIMTMIGLFVLSFTASAQTDAAQQLILNVEKLAQLKAILKNLYNGYEIVSKGYNRIKDISQGNYKLHEVFLDGLLQVSPSVRNYKKISDIIRYQQRIMQEQKQAYNHFKGLGSFGVEEISYLGNVYDKLRQGSLKNLDELLMVITASQLRMNDEERLAAIDRIYQEVEDRLSFLRSFNNSTRALAVQRTKEQREIDLSKKLNGLN